MPTKKAAALLIASGVGLGLLATQLPTPTTNTYPATLLRIIDCDTLEMNVKFPLGITIQRSVRIDGVNAPEITGPESLLGVRCKDRARFWLENRPELYLTGLKKGKYYGRMVADVVDGEGESFAGWLLDEGLAVRYDGRSKRPGFDPSGDYPVEVTQ